MTSNSTAKISSNVFSGISSGVSPGISLMRSRRGMTLIEILIVLGIIGLIMSILLPRVTGANDKAKVREASIRMSRVKEQLMVYYSDCNKYPKDLTSLLTAPSAEECSAWGPTPYLSEKELKDPWGHDFVYSVEGGNPKLMSLGKDGQPGGTGFLQDIVSE